MAEAKKPVGVKPATVKPKEEKPAEAKPAAAKPVAKPAATPSGGEGNPLALAALILGIIGILFFWIPFVGWIFPILAVIFGVIGMKKVKSGKTAKGYGFSLAGLIMGVVALVILILILTLFATMFATMPMAFAV